MATIEIQLTSNEVHAAISQYIKNKYDVKVISTIVKTGMHTSGYRTELRGATAEVQLKEK